MEKDGIGDIIRYWRWVGLFPYRRVNGRYLHFYRYHLPGVIAAILSCSAVISQLFGNVPFVPLSFFITITFGFFFQLILILNTFFRIDVNSPNVKKVLEELEQIDNLLRWNGFVFKSVAPLNSYLWYSLYSFLYMVLGIFSKPLSQCWLVISFSFGRFVWICCLLQVIELLHLIQHYFGLLESLVLTDCTLKQLRFLTKCYDRLCWIVSSLEDIYGFNILLAATSCFLFITTYTAFCIFWGISSMYYHISVEIMIFTAVPLSVIIFLLAKPCAKTHNAAKKFNMLLYQQMLKDRTNLLSSDIVLRMHMIMKREVIFTAYGFFTVDFTLIHSMVAALTTYLMCLIQLSSVTEPVPAAN